MCQQGKITADLAEAIAFKEAIIWIKPKDWQKVIVEIDRIKVVQSLRSSVASTSPFGLVISDCKQFMHEIVPAAFCFIKRSVNRVAHFLSRQSIFLPDRDFTEANVPCEMLSLCITDNLNE